MSILSDVTGIGINPFGKRKLKINPLKALGTAATLATFGGAGPLAGIAGKVGSVASHIPGAAKAAGAVSGVQRLLGSGGGGGGTDGVHLDPKTGLEIMNGADGGGTDWMGLAEGGLAGLSAYNAASANSRAGEYQDAALQHANERWQQGAPLRAAAVPRLLNPTRPNLSSVFNDPTNAFSRPAQPAPPNSASPVAVRRRMVA